MSRSYKSSCNPCQPVVTKDALDKLRSNFEKLISDQNKIIETQKDQLETQRKQIEIMWYYPGMPGYVSLENEWKNTSNKDEFGIPEMQTIKDINQQ